MRILLSICTILLLFGCSLNDGDKDVVIRIGDEFAVDMYEKLGTNRQLIFDLKSIDNQPCLNSSIERSLFKRSDQVTLHINGIAPISDCSPGEAPATGIANAGVMENKVYGLLISVRNTVENNGYLTIDDDSYSISFMNIDGIVLKNERLLKVPEKFVWGYVAYDDPLVIGEMPENFINELYAVGQPKTLHLGYYGHFSVAQGQELQLKEQPNKNYVQTFFFSFEGDVEDLNSIIESYRADPMNEGAEMSLYTSEGEVL